jgi:hypothetical protein
VAPERRAAAEEVRAFVDPDAAPCRAGGAAVHGTLATTDEIKHAEKLDLDLAIVLDVAEVNDLYVTGWRRELS